jgi:hypothetical protein
MLELIALLGGLIVCFYMPYEANRVRRDGWARKNFKGDPIDFRAAYLKQLTYLMWVGIGIGTVDAALAPLDTERGEWIFKLIIAAVWLTAGAIAFYLRSKMARQPA